MNLKYIINIILSFFNKTNKEDDMKNKNMDLLKEQLKKHEGIRLKPYKCTANKTTIGVGRNIEDRGITEDEAFYLLENDIKICVEELEKNYDWFKGLDDIRQCVLVNMCFNLGITRLKKFKNTMKHVEEGDYEKAALGMLNSRWAKQVKGRAIDLANQMEYGVF